MVRLSFLSNPDVLLRVLLLVCVVRFWIMPLPSSFWVDEMGTAFVVHYGAAHPSLAIAPQVPASVYYGLPAITEKLFGFSEVAYRVPSLLAMLGALVLFFRIGRSVLHPDACWFAAFACFSLRGFNYQAADARPYALGTLVFCLSVFLLLRWFRSGALLQGLLFAVAATFVWRIHLIFWPSYVLFSLYAAVRLYRRDTPVRWGHALGVFALLGVSLIPVALSAIALNREAGAHVVAPLPNGTELIYNLKLGMVTAGVAIMAVLARWFRWPRAEPEFPQAGLALILGWWLVHPLCLFVYSLVTRHSVFVSRYLFLALPGAALAATAAAAMFVPPARWKQLSLVLGLGVVLGTGRWNHLWPNHHNSDWRKASQAIEAQSAGRETPIVCPSPFIEARPPVWRPDYPIESFLYSHLLVYRPKGAVIPFPFESSPEAVKFATELAGGRLAESKRFLIYGGDANVLLWRDWFEARPELADWTARRLGPFGDVDVVVFDRGVKR